MSNTKIKTRPVAETEEEIDGIGRRHFLHLALGASAMAILPGCSEEARENFFQSHFAELSPEEVTERLERLEARYRRDFDRDDVTVSANEARRDVLFGYGLDLSVCVGCRRCAYACVAENNQSRDPQIQWIKVLEMDKEGGVNLEESNQYYDPELVPLEDKFYMPVQCQQCKNPPCVKTCPVGATWAEPDGIVVIDYDWCIGCRCCMAACPYGARRFNWSDPTIPSEELNPNTHYLGNRPRPRGVVEKCTFCIQRTREGRYPACLEVCPVGARKFGNLLDPESEIRYVIENKRVFILKEELNTNPKFFYFYTR